MKKLLILVLLISACSTTPDIVSQAWVDSVYNQGWYWPKPSSDPIEVSDYLVPFTSTGSFMAGFTPLSDRSDLPRQEVIYILDEVNENNTYAYYRLTYRFNGENLTLYHGVFHGHLATTGEHGIFWADLKNRKTLNPPIESASNNDKRAWLLETFTKNNASPHDGYALALKKSSRSTTSKSTTVENYIPNNSNAPTSANTSGTIKN